MVSARVHHLNLPFMLGNGPRLWPCFLHNDHEKAQRSGHKPQLLFRRRISRIEYQYIISTEIVNSRGESCATTELVCLANCRHENRGSSWQVVQRLGMAWHMGPDTSVYHDGFIQEFFPSGRHIWTRGSQRRVA